jgi:hypothetical protein
MKKSSFKFDPKGPKKRIQYALVNVNNYLCEETTVSISLSLEEALQEFLRKLIKMIKKDWGTAKSYFSEIDEIHDSINSINSWDDFFLLIDANEDLYENYENTYYIDIREEGEGYFMFSEIECLKKIYDLDKDVLNKYLPFS